MSKFLDEQLPSNITELSEALGHHDDEVSLHTRALLIEAIRAGNANEQAELYGEYCQLMEQKIEADPTSVEQQIALTLAVAVIFQEAGDTARYLEELEHAHSYAVNMELHQLAFAIETEINSHY